MPTAATSQNGPQAVGPYNYPQGERDGSEWEMVHRRGKITDDNRARDAVHTLEVSDGKGGLPITGQPTTIELGVRGVVQRGTHFKLSFQRLVGDTGLYDPLPPILAPPEGPGKPHTMAR